MLFAIMKTTTVPTYEWPVAMRPLRFALLGSRPGGSAYVLCRGKPDKWLYLHGRGRVRRPKRMLESIRLYTTVEEAEPIAAAYERQWDWDDIRRSGAAMRIQVVGWIAYCSDDGVDHEDCRACLSLSRACIESRRSGRDLFWRSAS